MADSIVNLKGFGWMGDTSGCSSKLIMELSDDFQRIFQIAPAGNDVPTGNKFLAGEVETGIMEIACGAGYLIYSDGVPYDVTGFYPSNLADDGGRIVSNWEETFSINGLTDAYSNGNGEYLLATKSMNGKPTYINENGWVIYWDGTEWSMTDDLNTNNLELKNGDNDPLGGNWVDTGGSQNGTGPNSPDPTCGPSTYSDVPYTTGMVQSGEFSVTNPQGLTGSVFKYNPADFSSEGLSKQIFVYQQDGGNWLVVKITTAVGPLAGQSPTVYWELESGECYSGQLVALANGDYNVMLSIQS